MVAQNGFKLTNMGKAHTDNMNAKHGLYCKLGRIARGFKRNHGTKTALSRYVRRTRILTEADLD
jgi:hypothetical protein